MPNYATTDDYYSAFGLTPSTDPQELARLTGILRSASARVTCSIRFARFSVGSDGRPRAARIREGFRDAVLAEARDVEVNGDTSAADEYDNVSMGGVTLSKSVRTSASTPAASTDDGPRTSEARMIIASLGILSPSVRS